MAIVTKQIREGAHFRFPIFAVGERNENERLHCPTIDFLQLAHAELPQELIKLTALLDHTAENGPPINEQKFKHLEGSDGLYEFKTKYLRLLCFFDEKHIIICVNGFVKKSKKTPLQTVKTATNWKQKYFEAKKNNLLTHEPEH